jgi:folate-binding protein YgfZ
LAAFCSAQGRVQASFIVVKTSAERVLLVISKDLLASTLKRLSMFVLRAKVKLRDASDQYRLVGLAGQEAVAAWPSDQAHEPWQCAPSSEGWTVQLYPLVVDEHSVPRCLRLVSMGQRAPEITMSEALWQWGEVRSGVTLISQAVYEAFVPQMLNYESVGGVNFKKGCYPGQEVVARSQFRGTLKRRLALAHSPVALQAGQEIFSPQDLTQPCGKVVLCAARPGQQAGFDALISGTLQSMEDGWLSAAESGQALRLLPLPYPLLDDI